MAGKHAALGVLTHDRTEPGKHVDTTKPVEEEPAWLDPDDWADLDD
jgi:hypothetical protein